LKSHGNPPYTACYGKAYRHSRSLGSIGRVDYNDSPAGRLVLIANTICLKVNNVQAIYFAYAALMAQPACNRALVFGCKLKIKPVSTKQDAIFESV
jgi:hypothetical protein